jgi:hypothetical protein
MTGRTHTTMFFLVSLYPLLIAVFFGSVIIDIVYSHLLANALSLSERNALFRDVSDVLLEIGLLVFLSGSAAILAAWHEKQAQVLFIVSLFVFFASEFLLPVVFMQQLRVAAVGLLLGPTIRVLANILAAAFAIMGFHKYAQSRHPPA